MYLIDGRSLIAIKEGGEFAFCFSPFPHFGYEDGLSPKLHEVDFSFGRVEEQEVDVHRYSKNIIQSTPHRLLIAETIFRHR